MSYTKYTWVTGEVITADKLNHMEDGIEAAGKTFEVEYDADNDYFLIKATPEELYVGAMAVLPTVGGGDLFLCVSKFTNALASTEQARIMLYSAIEGSLATDLYDYSEAAGGYIPHSAGGGGGGEGA